MVVVIIYSIDATNDDGTFGRLINHSKESPNTIPKVIGVQGAPNIYFEAIAISEEILYNYNDRCRDVPDGGGRGQMKLPGDVKDKNIPTNVHGNDIERT